MAPDNFVNVPVTSRNMDRWIVRLSILRAIERALPRFSGSLLDVGCGKMPYRDFILRNSAVRSYTGLDIESALVYDESVKPDITWNGREMPFAGASFDCVLNTEVFEHTPELRSLLAETKRVLKPGGLLFFTTPFVWPYHETPHDNQRWTSFALESELNAAGFHSVEIELVGNWHSSLAQFLGLWCARAPIPRLLRAALRYPLFGLQRWLMTYDGNSKPEENAMPRMLAGTARS